MNFVDLHILQIRIDFEEAIKTCRTNSAKSQLETIDYK